MDSSILSCDHGCAVISINGCYIKVNMLSFLFFSCPLYLVINVFVAHITELHGRYILYIFIKSRRSLEWTASAAATIGVMHSYSAVTEQEKRMTIVFGSLDNNEGTSEC